MAVEVDETLKPKRDGRKERGERSGTLVSYVRDRILDDIVQGRIASGDVIQLRTLADRYEVSKTPVREALSQLQREGLGRQLPSIEQFLDLARQTKVDQIPGGQVHGDTHVEAP